MAAVLGREFAIYSYEKKAPNRLSPLFAGMFSLLPCKDGYYQLHVREDRQWWGLAEVMGDPDWAHWEIFKDAPSRSENWHILEPLLVKWSMEHTKDEICRACQAKQLASMPVNSIDESLNYEHLVARQFLAEIDHPEAGRLRYPGAPCKFSKTPWRVNRPAPLLGQHNEEVFCYRLGYSKLELVKMMEAGVI
jgi:crotonobetainyl-CoA:carnitine CoA-transferase CaiB-like acyl-CoA transferase